MSAPVMEAAVMSALMIRAPALQLCENDVVGALHSVIDPELDEPITDLGFVRSISITDKSIEVHLRLPTSFCAPNFAYLMASDAKDALTELARPGMVVVVELDDHHDSPIINCGLASDAGYKGTFLHEAESDLDELRSTFERKAHTASMERALTAFLRTRPDLSEGAVGETILDDLPDDDAKAALIRRRVAIGLSAAGTSVVLVDHIGMSHPPESVALVLRRARSTRISIDGNAHFCRGLLATRYPGSEADQTPTRPDNFFALTAMTTPIARKKQA